MKIKLVMLVAGFGLSGCSTNAVHDPAPRTVDLELKQDYAAKSREVNKKLRAEWIEIDARSGAATQGCPSYDSKLKFDKTKSIDNLNACIHTHSWLTADRWAQALMEFDVNSPWGPYFMSLVSEGRNQIARAQWMIDLALSRAPHVGGLAYQKARLFWKTENYREALAWAARSVTEDSEFGQGYFMMGQIYFRDHEWKEAFANLQKANQFGLQQATLALETAECALIFNDKHLALEQFQKAIKLGALNQGIEPKIAVLEKAFAQEKAAVPRNTASDVTVEKSK